MQKLLSPVATDSNLCAFSHFKNDYLYTANGQKLMKQTRTDFAVEQTMDYIGNFVYEDNQLRYILTDEGRAIAQTNGTFEYQYFLKDHLGNTRITFNQGGQIIQEDAYYPFGMTMKGLYYQSGVDYENKYLYNGKEFQDDFGLDWYDYGARFYDPVIGRWHVVDPMVEKYPHVNPFTYCLNNPIRLVDPDGKEPTPDEAVALVKHINSYFNSEVKLLGGWKLDKPYDDRNQSGFTGGKYSRVKEDGSTEYAFVTRGSDLDFSKLNRESTLKDWINNFKQLLGATEQYKESVNIAKQLSSETNDELTFVGQSLGGGLASANALATGRRGITFNAAGLSDATLKDLSLNNKTANITAWIIKGEIVYYLQSMIPGVNRAYSRRVELMPSLPYVPGISPHLEALQIYQRVQNHFIEAFEGNFD